MVKMINLLCTFCHNFLKCFWNIQVGYTVSPQVTECIPGHLFLNPVPFVPFQSPQKRLQSSPSTQRRPHLIPLVPQCCQQNSSLNHWGLGRAGAWGWFHQCGGLTKVWEGIKSRARGEWRASKRETSHLPDPTSSLISASSIGLSLV